jgi:cell division protein ZapA
MKSDGRPIEVTILDRTLRIACKEEEKEDLLRAVQYLDSKMREIRDSGKVIGAERIALLAALNIAHELLSMRLGAGFDIAEFKGRMQSMAAAIDEAMSAQEDLF